MYTYDEALGQEAEIISIRGRMARLRWRDDSETSALLSNLAKIQMPESTYDPAYHERLTEERSLLLDAAISVRKAWATNPTE